jgi:hypothetical protein
MHSTYSHGNPFVMKSVDSSERNPAFCQQHAQHFIINVTPK